MEKQKGFLEESLAESQGKDVCRALFDGSPDAIFLADPKTGVILDANPAAERLLGRSVKNLIGLHQTDLHPQRRQDASLRIFGQHSLSEGETVSSGPEEHYALKADGSEVPIEITAKIIKIKGRRILQGFFRDISARKEAETALRESEELYRTLVNNAPAGIVVHSMGVMRFVNREMAELVRVPGPEAVVGRNVLEFMHPDYRGLVKERIRRAMQEGLPMPPAEEKLVASDGTVLYVEIRSVPITYRGEPCVMAIVQDITDRKRAEAEAQAAHRQLVEANSELEHRVAERTVQLAELNTELEAFSYSAAHDMKAPLRRVNIFSEMLAKEAEPELKPEHRAYLGTIRKSVSHMIGLVESLLLLSTTGRRPLDKTTASLSAVLKEAAAETPHGPGVEWALAELPAANCDRAMIKQVLANLLSNAVKYSRGSVPQRIEVTYRLQAGEHVIGVRDNGVGFDMAFSDKLFGVFQRLHREDDFEGSGIGLSIVKRVILRHGGRVWAESEPGKGAAFYFTLPS